MSTVEIEITGAELQAGDVIITQFGAREVHAILERTVYTTYYITGFCRECSCSNKLPITVRRAL